MIYVIRMTGTDYYKIGYTDRSVEQRLDELQTGNPVKLMILEPTKQKHPNKLECITLPCQDLPRPALQSLALPGHARPCHAAQCHYITSFQSSGKARAIPHYERRGYGLEQKKLLHPAQRGDASALGGR